MKTKTLILAALALSAVVACNKENKENPVINGGEAYIAVQIAYANPTTRGTSPTDPFAYGTAEENKISGTANFFFYSDAGAYVTHAAQTITGSANTATPAENVEWIGNGVVVLKGLTSTSSPKYMAVVLNGSDALITNLKGKSITEARSYITEEYADKTVTTAAALDKFTMTSTSYNNSDAASGYYCSALTNTMFKESEADAAAAAASGTDVAVAYVERLAVKATLGVTAASSVISGTTVYSLGTGTEVYDGTGAFTNPLLYVKVNGWGLNSTTKNSYTYKNIDTSWDFSPFTWNDATNFRSYWAKSTNYSLTDPVVYYPDMYANSTSKNYDATKNTLNYISYNDCAVNVGANAYCRENTNTKAVLTGNNFSSTATCVLLTAQVVDNSAAPVQLVIFEHRYYTKDGYLDFVLNRNTSDVPYVMSGTSYVKADKTYLDIVNDGDAYIHVNFKAEDASGAAITYYTDDTGSTTKAVADINATWNKTLTLAEYYKDGMMYYNIPVEHLRNKGTFAKGTYDEADYGVVRNHWYSLDITKIANLGHPVAVPDEPIVPSDDDAKKYYVAAKINILSWKVVKQSVEL